MMQERVATIPCSNHYTSPYMVQIVIAEDVELMDSWSHRF